MRRWVLIAAVLGAGMVGAATLASGAVLVNQAANPSFEKPIGDMVGCGGVSAGNWTSVNAGGATQPVVVTSPVHRGRKAGQVRNDVEHGAADVANRFAQALPSFGASSQISLSSWVYPIAGIEEIELEGGTNWCIAENVALSFECDRPRRESSRSTGRRRRRRRRSPTASGITWSAPSTLSPVRRS